MQQQTVNRSFLFIGNFPVYNLSNGLFDGEQPADFTVNGRILYEFDVISLRFDAFNGNPYFCDISIGRPYAVEFGLGGLAALIELIKNRKKAPQGHYLPLAITAYNQNNLQYQTLGFVSVTENSVTFYANNGIQQQQFTIKGDLQIEMFIGYLNSLQKLAIEVIAGKEMARFNNRFRGNGGTATESISNTPAKTPTVNNISAPSIPTTSATLQTSAPTTSATPQTSAPTTSATPQTSAPTTSATPQTSAPTTSAAPQTSAPQTVNSAPVIDMPEIQI